jgi:hypothetical protein
MSETLDVTLLFLPDGTVQAICPDGSTFEIAGPALAELLDLIGSDGAPIRRTGEPEKHRHEAPARKAGISFGSRAR